MTSRISYKIPPDATAAIILNDGLVFFGHGFGKEGAAEGEICFNTAMAGYQEILTDPSYAGQIITFTFPHIGNTGCTPEDMESAPSVPSARGLITRMPPGVPSSWRNEQDFDAWLADRGVTGISGIDTRALTRRIRDLGAPNGLIYYNKNRQFDLPALLQRAQAIPSLEGRDLASEVSCKTPYVWNEGRWSHATGFTRILTPDMHIVAVDYGIKHNILRCLAGLGARVTVVPCDFPAADILSLKPDGIFLSNGPGDPAATGRYAVPILKNLLASDLPLFGICLGHQLLALALGGRTEKLKLGHRGANHPIKDLETGKIEITSQNHGFHVIPDSLHEDIIPTHISLFDGTNEGLRLKNRPVFSVQYHPEASPGPEDSHGLFLRFAAMIREHRAKTASAGNHQTLRATGTG